MAILGAFGLPMEAETRLGWYLPIFAVFGSFSYYLPELFPTRLRATGAGLSYNVGRIVAAAGPLLVGAVAARGEAATQAALETLFFVGWVPLLALLVIPWTVEARDRPLP